MTRWRRLGLVLTGLCLLGTGCVGMPDEGPVVETQAEVDTGEELGYYNDPQSPVPGESPTDIVKHFLDAQAAIPIQTNTASEFLTRDFASTWRPQQRTITYAAASLPQGSNQITVELDGANQIDGRGRWRGSLPERAEELSFSMQREDGEWRIADAPDALVVPESWFSQAYRRVSLYFFDPSARILIPEPVYVPRGERLASALVAGLLQGPTAGGQVERSFIPSGLEVDLSVPVTGDGVAEVALTGDGVVPAPQDAQLMVAQLARTLAQDPSLTGFRVTIAGEPVALPGGRTTFAIDQGDSFDADAIQSTSLLFGLREGRLVSGPPDVLSYADGPMGAEAQGLRSVGVDLTGSRVAGVSVQGDRVLVSEVRDPGADLTQVVSGAEDLLPPAWDFAGRLWLVDRGGGDARVSVVRGREPREVRVPGITGEDVTHAIVSRDGSRLVAVVRDRRADRVLVSRIAYDARGRPRAGSRAREIAWDDIPRPSVIDLAWSSPTSLAVLHRLNGALSQARTMAVDGAPVGLTGIASTFSQRTRAVLSTPRATDPVYVVSRAGLVDVLSGQQVVAEPEASFLTYVG
ncbi:LpqB family beta-propeller domain-containing protein [Nocardioides coralli]|uniref:LpqB family beta-propeller domain-containing protein n=1 Tax=Nocardioides coralli TaxID=2872154 RepID=UPI001CA3CF75|nr:LpqB family beta-propeller domain-containing protein [Nocardioides coralli]QZY30026.1 GerMN domain-containing protein [Nocardioides coralli]